MKTAGILKNVEYNESRPAITPLMETDHSKELRIAIKKGQKMKEHQTPYPIVVEIFEGAINFGVNGETHSLQRGDIVALEGGVPHDLLGEQDSIVRLTLNKSDSVQRVENVVK